MTDLVFTHPGIVAIVLVFAAWWVFVSYWCGGEVRDFANLIASLRKCARRREEADSLPKQEGEKRSPDRD
jgi:hypothetical protein